jgi:hypothetical protein
LRATENKESTLLWSISIELKMRTYLIKRGVIVVAALLPLAGCSAAPSTNILGSYFPSWMICVLIGMGLALVFRWVLVKLGIEKELPAPIVVYLAATTAFSFAAWLLWLA